MNQLLHKLDKKTSNPHHNGKETRNSSEYFDITMNNFLKIKYDIIGFLIVGIIGVLNYVCIGTNTVA